MKKQTLGHQSNHVTKSERVENLWKKLIRQETDLSDETITWMTRRIRLLTEYMAYGCALIAYRKQNGDFYMARATLVYYETCFHRKYDIERIPSAILLLPSISRMYQMLSLSYWLTISAILCFGMLIFSKILKCS